MIYTRSLVVLSIVLICICRACAVAATVNVDFLGGWGDFEYAGDTSWQSYYTGTDYDFDTQSGWTSAVNSSGWRMGWDPATPSNSVAVGWSRLTGSTVHPRNNVTYSIVPGGINGSNCQFFCLQGLTSGSAWAMLQSTANISSVSSDAHPGDTVTFHVDSIRMSGYDSLPAGSTVKYAIGFKGQTSKTLTASTTAFSDEVSFAVPRSAAAGWLICPIVEIETSGPLGAAQPGIYVDGAHLYVKRASNPTSYATWNVPVTVTKGVKTFVNRWDWGAGFDLYTLAQNCDSMVVGEADGAFAARMKYLNPNIRTYLYQIYACLDQRDSRGIDVWYSASPTQMGWLLNNNHRDWLWANGVGGFVSAPSGPYLYDMHVANSDYQSVLGWGCASEGAQVEAPGRIHGFDDPDDPGAVWWPDHSGGTRSLGNPEIPSRSCSIA